MITTSSINAMLDSLITGPVQVALSTTKPLLSSTDPSGVIAVTEPTGGSYARVTLPLTGWEAAADRMKRTSTDITFPAPTGDWGSVGWVVIYSGTEVIFFGALDRLVDVTAGGDQLNIPANTLSIYMAE